MKKYILLFIILVLAIMFSGCNVEETPKEPEQEISDFEEEPKKEVYADFSRAGVMGAVNLSVGDRLGDWVLEELEVFYYPNGEIRNVRGYFSGDCEIEAVVTGEEEIEAHHFGFDIEITSTETDKFPVLVTDEGFSESAYFLLATDEYREKFYGYEKKFQEVLVVDRVYFDYNHGVCAYALSAKETKSVEAKTVNFTLGTNGEPVELSVGDTIGEFTVGKIRADIDGEYSHIEVDFSSYTSMNGYLELNGMGVYVFHADESEYKNLPFFVSDFYTQDEFSFIAKFSDGSKTWVELSAGEKYPCRVTIKSYSFVSAPMEAMPVAVIYAMGNVG